MSYSIKGKRITLTRGDSLATPVAIYRKDGTEYELQDGDTVRFMARTTVEDSDPVIVKDVTSGTLTVRKRYNSSYSLTVNSDYKVDVYKLVPPTGMVLFE